MNGTELIQAAGFALAAGALSGLLYKAGDKPVTRDLVRYVDNDDALIAYQARLVAAGLAPVRNIRAWGYEEGERCNRLGCGGTMRFREVTGCTCFQSAPCWRCVENQPACDTCLEQAE
jgi:hypothetical protein